MNLLDDLQRNLRCAVRVPWKRSPGSACIVLTLALGIGASTAPFFCDTVMLKLLPVKAPGAIAFRWAQSPVRYPCLELSRVPYDAGPQHRVQRPSRLQP